MPLLDPGLLFHRWDCVDATNSTRYPEGKRDEERMGWGKS